MATSNMFIFSAHRSRTLSHLPVELLQEIASYTSPKEQYKLCLVSRVVRASVQPILFQHYRPSWKKSPLGSIRPLLRTLTDCPDLASNVQSMMMINYQKSKILPDQYTKSKWAKKVDSQIEAIKRKLWEKLEGIPDQLGAIRNKYLDADQDLILLLSLTKNLKRLTIEFDDEEQFVNRLAGHLIRPSAPEQTFLRHLTALKVHSGNKGRYSLPFSELRALLMLPSLTTFQGIACHQSGMSYRKRLYAPNTLHIQHLNLYNCTLSPLAMKDLIAGCKELKSLNITYRGPSEKPFDHVCDIGLDSMTILSMLECQEESLESLVLDIHEIHNGGIEKRRGYLDLSWFERLRNVELRSWAWPTHSDFFGPGIEDPLSALLPSSIEVFTIRDCDDYILSLLIDQVGLFVRNLPALQRVTVLPWGRSVGPEIRALRKGFERADIEFNDSSEAKDYFRYHYL